MHLSIKNIDIILSHLITNKLFKYLIIINDAKNSENSNDIENGNHRTLSCFTYPLNKYNLKFIQNYLFTDTNHKEISYFEIK